MCVDCIHFTYRLDRVFAWERIPPWCSWGWQGPSFVDSSRSRSSRDSSSSRGKCPPCSWQTAYMLMWPHGARRSSLCNLHRFCKYISPWYSPFYKLSKNRSVWLWWTAQICILTGTQTTHLQANIPTLQIMLSGKHIMFWFCSYTSPQSSKVFELLELLYDESLFSLWPRGATKGWLSTIISVCLERTLLSTWDPFTAYKHPPKNLNKVSNTSSRRLLFMMVWSRNDKWKPRLDCVLKWSKMMESVKVSTSLFVVISTLLGGC